MRRDVRAIFVVNSLGFGGAERQTLSVFRTIYAENAAGILAVLKDQPRELPEAESMPTEQIWRGHFKQGVDIAGIRNLSRLIRTFSPAVIVTVNSYPLVVSLLASALAPQCVRLINVYHTTELPDAHARRQFVLFRVLMNRISKVVYVCNAQRRYWTARGLRTNNSIVIHNGIPADFGAYNTDAAKRQQLRQTLGFRPEDIVVGICAGLRPEKAHRDLIDAVATLRTEGKPYVVLIIGDGPCRNEIQEFIKQTGMEHAAVMIGLQEDIRPFVAAADIMTLVSRSVETFSIAALEAMALSKPLVLSDIGGASEQVINGFNGYLFEKGNIEQLSDCLLRLSDEASRLQMGQNSLQLLRDKFTFEAMVQKYTDMLNDRIDPS